MLKKLQDTLDHIARNRMLQHVLFWCLSYLILINILKVSAGILPIDAIYALIFHLPIFFVVYINLFLLVPFFMARRKFVIYSFLIAVTVAGGSFFYLLLFERWVDYIFPGYYFVAFYDFVDISLFLAIYVAVTSLVKLARGWFKLQEIEKEKTLTELKALKSQINPHFLFNSLNSIYSLSRKSAPVLPEAILNLSSLMRYVIYETDVELISLKKEVEIIKEYIDLQKLRMEDANNISFNVEDELGAYKIAPLLLLPFVENSFKHGIKGGAEKVFVNIKLEISGAILNFEIENSIGKSVELDDQKYKGIGIHNVKKRLELLYPDKHVLKSSEYEGRFRVLLQLQLKK